MVKKIFDKPSFSLFNNYEFINNLRNKVNEIIEIVNSGGSGGSGEIIYSLDERKVGSWLGEDLFQKTIQLDLSQINTDTRILSKTFVDNIIVKKAEFYLSDSTGSCITTSDTSHTKVAGTNLNNLISNYNNFNLSWEFLSADIDESLPAEIDIYIGENLISYENAYVTIWYTKIS